MSTENTSAASTAPLSPERADSLVIIPMYNEKENAAAIIDAVMNLPVAFDVLVVDDNSPDGTADIVKSKMPNFRAASTS